MLPVPAFGIFRVLVVGFAACAAISVRDIQPTSTLRRKHPLYLMEYPKGRNGQQVAFNHRAPGCKPKDLIGIPWLVALALRGDGWYLRSSIIWHKTNPMPESTRDRPTRCYEYVFLLTKSKKYYYDWQAVAEPIAPTTAGRLKSGVSKGNKYNVTVPGQNQPQKINRPREKGAYADELISPVRSRRNVLLPCPSCRCRKRGQGQSRRWDSPPKCTFPQVSAGTLRNARHDSRADSPHKGGAAEKRS